MLPERVVVRYSQEQRGEGGVVNQNSETKIGRISHTSPQNNINIKCKGLSLLRLA